MTRYVENLVFVRRLLVEYSELSPERVEKLSSCKCWLFVDKKLAHVVFRTETRPDYYEHFTFWHLGTLDPIGYWTS